MILKEVLEKIIDYLPDDKYQVGFYINIGDGFNNNYAFYNLNSYSLNKFINMERDYSMLHIICNGHNTSKGIIKIDLDKTIIDPFLTDFKDYFERKIKIKHFLQ